MTLQRALELIKDKLDNSDSKEFRVYRHELVTIVDKITSLQEAILADLDETAKLRQENAVLKAKIAHLEVQLASQRVPRLFEEIA